MKKIRVHPDRCTGCESCVLSCSFYHEEDFGLTLSRINLEMEEEVADFTPQVCIQCEGRFCISACPQDALTVDAETGAIELNRAKCTGCGLCGEACPHSGVHFPEKGSEPLICDLCGGDPECVKACGKPEALEFVSDSEVNNE